MDIIDPTLKQWATPRQAEFIDAVNLHGSVRGAEKALNLANDVVGRAIRAAKTRQLTHDRACHLSGPVDPYMIKGTSTLYDQDGAPKLQWVKTSLDHQQLDERIKAAVEGMSAEIPRVDPIEFLAETNADLANLYVFTDYHFGMLAWGQEGGADWDLKIAEAMIMKVMEQMVNGSPRSRVGVLGLLGDLLHADGLIPVTPTHGHVLDADGRFSKVVQVAIKAIRRLIDLMLMRHEEVHIIIAEGNHDIASSLWLRIMFKSLYENEPRVIVNTNELPYYVYQHGETMLAFHHGHIKKREQLPLLFAAEFPRVWGTTTKRYAHCGHQHHERVLEMSGMKVIQHPTLAARDAHSSRGGYISERQASCITYHVKHGKVGEVVVTPEMVA